MGKNPMYTWNFEGLILQFKTSVETTVGGGMAEKFFLAFQFNTFILFTVFVLPTQKNNSKEENHLKVKI